MFKLIGGTISNEKIVDFNVLEQLKTDMSEDFYPELLKIFLSQGNQRVVIIERAIMENDFATLKNEIHSFKSESATFGAMQLYELIRRINSLCHQEEKEQAFIEAAAIKKSWQLVYSVLHQ